MSNSSTPLTPEVLETTSTATQKHDNIAHVKAQVTLALSALDSLYKKNISDYAKELHKATRNIENTRYQLAELYKEKEPHTNALHAVEKEVDYALRLVERLTEQWCQKSLVIKEIEIELSQLSQTEKEQKQILKDRNDSLVKIHLEIENIELSLLEHELEKQNILLFIEPIERKITILEQTIKELESEKQYIETSHLHQLSPAILS